MKAWYVWVSDEGGEIHWGETAGKAKVKALQRDEIIQADCPWCDICAKRAPAFDGEVRTLSPRDWIEAGYSYPCSNCECPVTKDGRWCDNGQDVPFVFSEDGEVYCGAFCEEQAERRRRRWEVRV